MLIADLTISQEQLIQQMIQPIIPPNNSPYPSHYKDISNRFCYGNTREDMLGGGSFGAVYKGWDKEQKKKIAVKVLKRFGKTLRWEGNELLEVVVLRQMSGQHPNILRFLGSIGSRFDSQLYIMTELCQRGTLTNLIAKLTELEIFHIFRQLVDGMSFLNQQNIFHRDLKPDNLLITAKNELKIADLGSARPTEGNSQTSTQYTPQYAPPQVYLKQYRKDGKYDKKCDVFSAGCILYEMLAGERYNKEIKRMESIEDFFKHNCEKGFIIKHPSISPQWARLIEAMLSYQPEKRPSFAQLASILKGFQAPMDKLPPLRCPSKIQEEKSGSYMQKIKKVVGLMVNRNNYFINVLRVLQRFQEERSQLVPRIYKIIFLYLSLSLYCLYSDDCLVQLERKQEFKIDDISVQQMENSMTVKDRGELNSFLKDMKVRINAGKMQISYYLVGKVIADIEEVASLPEDNLERVVLEEFKIIQQARRKKQGEVMGDSPTYRIQLTKCVNNLYRTSEELQSISKADLAIYLVLLYTANLKYYVKLEVYITSMLPPNFQKVLAMGREELCSQISLEKNRTDAQGMH